MEKFTYKDIIVRWDAETLEVGNSTIRRIMNIADGFPKTVSLGTPGSPRELVKPSTAIDVSFMGYNQPGRNNAKYEITGITAKTVPGDLYEPEHVTVSLEMTEPKEKLRLRREYIIYPELPALSVRNFLTAAVIPNVYWTYRERLRLRENRMTNGPIYNTADALVPADTLTNRLAVEFLGRTDYSCDQVFEYPSPAGSATGNLLYVDDDNAAGFVILQEAPPSAERRDMELFDFKFEDDQDGRIVSCSWGVSPSEIVPGKEYQSYRHTVILYNNGDEKRSAVHNYLTRRYIDDPANHVVMVNPWGCGDFATRAGEKFLLEEIAAAEKFGAECYQIDDGWQRGGSLWELICANHHIGREFWDVAPQKFSDGLNPLAKTADEHGIELALWTAPSFNTAYRDGDDFAEMVLKYHKKYGFRFFKIDSMVLGSYESERNIEKMFRMVRTASDGKVLFNLDVTNGQRGGYFYLLEYGTLFFENRYIGWTEPLGYHPEHVLRSLWRLAKYTRAQYLQIEIPYRRMLEKLTPDPDSTFRVNPGKYSWSYWGAVAMFANMLLWLAPSTVEDDDIQELREVVELHKKYRSKIFAGDILPVGAEPDGAAITALWSRRSDGGMLLVFREEGCRSATAEIDLGATISAPRPVGGDRRASAVPNGEKLNVTMPENASFTLFEY